MKIPPGFVSGCNQDVLGKSWALERKALACEAESHESLCLVVISIAMNWPFHRKTIGKSQESHRKTIGKP